MTMLTFCRPLNNRVQAHHNGGLNHSEVSTTVAVAVATLRHAWAGPLLQGTPLFSSLNVATTTSCGAIVVVLFPAAPNVGWIFYLDGLSKELKHDYFAMALLLDLSAVSENAI